MKSSFQYLIIGALFCLPISCDKEPCELSKKYEFEGEWLWVKTTADWAPTVTPEILGHSMSLVIDSIHYTSYLNDSITAQYSYEYEELENEFGNIEEYITLETGHKFLVTIDPMHLILSETVIDSLVWYYIRK